MASMVVTRLDPADPTWPARVDELRAALGAPDNPRLLPPHFLKSTFPKIGGHVVRFEAAGRLVAGGFLCPRDESGVRARGTYTLRFHRVAGAAVSDDQLGEITRSHLGSADPVPYDADAAHEYRGTADPAGDAEVGHPDAAEALAIRDMQRAIWDTAPDFLYPADIHSVPFALGTSLVARVDGEPAGFLFGFATFDGEPLPADWHPRLRFSWRLESQLMGVLPRFRGRNLSFWLKRAQALEARRQGVDIVNWTVDPLQWTNAVLNFGLLRAIAFGFHPDYYAFRNSLNRVSASRLGLTWLVNSNRVDAALVPGSRAEILDLAAEPAIPRFNQPAPADARGFTGDRLAIEIPADWTALQRDNPDAAARWREGTDAVFGALLGVEVGRYALTGVGTDGPRKYLIAERVTPATLERWIA